MLEEAEPDALAYLDLPPSHRKRLRADNVQERANREIKRRPRVAQVLPPTASPVRLAGAVMCEQDEIWQGSRYFSGARVDELYDEGRGRGTDGKAGWARLEAEARKMLESGLELADRVEADRISNVFQVPGRRADSLRIGRYTNFPDTTGSAPGGSSTFRWSWGR